MWLNYSVEVVISQYESNKFASALLDGTTRNDLKIFTRWRLLCSKKLEIM